MSRPAQVILCGPFPAPGRIGGYARSNELIATSSLQERFGIERLAITGAGDGWLLARLRRDLRATAGTLLRCSAPVFHLTAQYQRGTYREFLQQRLAIRSGRRILLDIRAGCFRVCFERASAPLQRALLRRMLAEADAIAVEGLSDAAWIRECFGREALWLPNFVRSSDRASRPRAHLDPPAAREPLRIVYSGRLSAEKGVLELLGAVAKLAEGGRPARLALIGRGDARFERELGRRIDGLPAGAQVVLHGDVQQGRLPELLAESHIFAFPSRWLGEGHSNAVNEAMQAGLPIVCSDQGFLPDVVDSSCGLVLARPDGQALAQALADLASDWSGLRRMGAAAWERVYREFGDEKVLPRLAELYEALLAAPRRTWPEGRRKRPAASS